MKDNTELADAIRVLAGRVTELTELTRGNIVNHVLWSGTIAIPASGVHAFDFSVPMASFAAQASVAAGLITIAAAPPAGATPPVSGAGVFTVEPDGMICFPVTGRILSIYGSPGDFVAVAISTRPWPIAGA